MKKLRAFLTAFGIVLGGLVAISLYGGMWVGLLTLCKGNQPLMAVTSVLLSAITIGVIYVLVGAGEEV